VLKFLGLFTQTVIDSTGFINSLFCSISSNLFRYPHAAEMGTTHTAKMSRFRAFLRQGLTKLMPIISALIGLAVNSSLCRLIPVGSVHHGLE
jgi:hypothetical protein